MEEERMMKAMKKCVAVLAMAVVTLTGCASFDASAYLKAILDNSYKNDSTAFVEQKVGTKEEAADLYQQGIDANMSQLSGYTMDDATKAEMEKLFGDIYAAADYTVGEAEKDGKNFNVTVTYRPMTLMTDATEAYMAAIEEKTTELTQRAMSGEEISDEEIEKMAIDLYLSTFKDQLANIQYGEETSMVIRIELTDNVYAPNQTDLANFEAAVLGIE